MIKVGLPTPRALEAIRSDCSFASGSFVLCSGRYGPCSRVLELMRLKDYCVWKAKLGRIRTGRKKEGDAAAKKKPKTSAAQIRVQKGPLLCLSPNSQIRSGGLTGCEEGKRRPYRVGAAVDDED